MKRFSAYIIFVLALAWGLFFVFGGNNQSSPAQHEKNNFSQHPGSASLLPERLNIEFPDEISSAQNPCYSLEIPENVKQKRDGFSERTQNTKNRSREILDKHDLPLEIYRGTQEGKKVALTIDTGVGGAYGVRELLQMAQHYDVPLTFFVTGCWVLENPELTQRIFEAGHSVGSHSLTHLNLAGASAETAKREFAETDRIIEETLGFKPLFFRKPQYAGGERVNNIAAEFNKIVVQGYPNLGDTTGWHSKTTAEDVLARVKRDTEPGAIWVFHNLSTADLSAFEEIVRFHLEEGYELVEVEKIL